jgi:hypothetical protein
MLDLSRRPERPFCCECTRRRGAEDSVNLMAPHDQAWAAKACGLQEVRLLPASMRQPAGVLRLGQYGNRSSAASWGKAARAKSRCKTGPAKG